MTNRGRFLFSMAAGLVCASLLWFIRLTHQARADAAIQLATAQARQVKLAAAVEQARKTTASPAAASTAAAGSAKTAAAPVMARPRKRAPSLMDVARDKPEVLQLFVLNQKADLQQRYGVLFQNLQLTAAQRERFKEILAARSARGMDIGAVADEQGLKWDDPAIKKLNDDSNQQMEKELATFLGDAGYRSYQEFERTIRVRGFIDGFAVQVASSDPLTGAQAERLARAMTAASADFQKGQEADPRTLDWAAVDRAAVDILSPTQLAAWKLGVAHSYYFGSRAQMQMQAVYDAAIAKNPPKP